MSDDDEVEVDHACTGIGCRECREHNDEQSFEWERHEGAR